LKSLPSAAAHRENWKEAHHRRRDRRQDRPAHLRGGTMNDVERVLVLARFA